MKFSIRDILGLIVLVALGVQFWHARTTNSNLRAGLPKLEEENRLLEVKLFWFHESNADKQRELAELRSQVVAGFENVVEKYGEIKPTEKLSFRSVPSLSGLGRTVYRIYVPNKQDIWLKWGIIKTKNEQVNPNTGEFLTNSSFKDSGPFQTKLPQGACELVIETSPVEDGQLPFKILLDEKCLIDSSYVSSAVSGVSLWGQSGWERQEKYRYRSSLATFGMMPNTPNEVDPEGFTIWFGEKEDDFRDFPGENQK